jgi:rfaE bifunctional protein kinase chain/domain
MLNLTVSRVKEILTATKGKTIAVIGDVMLDRYFWGSVSRISPEAPVPVIDIEKETFHLGGAANVANNLKSLGISPLLCGILGDDNSGKMFANIANESGIDASGLYLHPGRPTTVKTRIIGNNQQIARLDREVRDAIPIDIEQHILKALQGANNLSGIIFEDYNKGTVTEFLILEVMAFAKMNNIPVFVDPKFENFYNFKQATVFKPNRKEASMALGLPLKTREEVIIGGKLLLEKLDAKNVMLTLGADGMMLFESNGDVSSVETRARMVADVSGAGDTAIATMAASIAAGSTIKESATMANLAAGAVCEKPGIVSITPNEIFDSVVRNSTEY